MVKTNMLNFKQAIIDHIKQKVYAGGIASVRKEIHNIIIEIRERENNHHVINFINYRDTRYLYYLVKPNLYKGSNLLLSPDYELNLPFDLTTQMEDAYHKDKEIFNESKLVENFLSALLNLSNSQPDVKHVLPKEVINYVNFNQYSYDNNRVKFKPYLDEQIAKVYKNYAEEYDMLRERIITSMLLEE